MTDKELAKLLIEKVADAKIDKKIAVFVNRLMLRLHSQPAFLSSLDDVAVFKPGSETETDDQVEDGEFNESREEEEKSKSDNKADRTILQLSFRRLPQEVIAPLIRLIAGPREPRLSRYTKDGSARIGIELELRPNDFPGDDYDYSF